MIRLETDAAARPKEKAVALGPEAMASTPASCARASSRALAIRAAAGSGRGPNRS